MRYTLRIVMFLIAVEALSLLGFINPPFAPIFFVMMIIAAALCAYMSPLIFLAATFAELMIGGMGYLFSVELFGFVISIRLALFVIACAAAFFHGILRGSFFTVTKNIFWRKFVLLGFFIVFGIARGFSRGNSLQAIFFDSNAYFFLLYIWIWSVFIQSRKDIKNILPYFHAAALFLAFKTMIVYFVFTHAAPINTALVYKWIRDTGVGELTPSYGGFYRVFFQSHIYIIAAWIYTAVAFVKNTARRQTVYLFALSALFISALIVSLSRSFAFSFVLSAGAILCAALVWWRRSLKETARAAFCIVAGIVGGLLIVFAVTWWPYPARNPFVLFDAYGARLDWNDAAASSRWAQVKPLWRAIQRDWILGAGFGATVTYISNDPRARAQNPSGEYTASAFEWGYLDIWLKIGVFGLLAYLALIKDIFMRLFHEARKCASREQWEGLQMPAVFAFSLFAVAIVNIFTPYLNHPLGFGILILSALWTVF